MESKEEKEVIELEKRISELPVGYISRKTINGKIKLYHQWTEDGKKKSKYVSDTAALELEKLINERRELQRQLKILKVKIPQMKDRDKPLFKTYNLVGDNLRSFITPISSYKKRFCYSELEDYLYNDTNGKVFVLYGLRRTGKTTLMRQAIYSMNKEDFEKTVYVQVKKWNTLADVNEDLKIFLEKGYKYVFIDEITLLEDFIEGAALFSDIFASCGMKIILSGTDSLGFIISKSEQLYDRCILLHSTFIPYREFEGVLGIKGIDEYIRYGGTMSIGGTHYNGLSIFRSPKSTDEYIDSAIAKNIQHSLKNYDYEGHFRHLYELYEKDELTNAINRIVEDINHRFTLEVLTKNFKSNDFSISRNNLKNDKNGLGSILDKVDEEKLTKKLKERFEIKNRDEQIIGIKDIHKYEIKEYLDLLDLTIDIDMKTIPSSSEKQTRTVFTQPGMRYCQAETLVKELIKDIEFEKVDIKERQYIINRILDEVKGRMMEDIIIMETKQFRSNEDVFKLQFAIGEFDMVVANEENCTCEIFEIKHSKERVDAQYKHLIDEKKCKDTTFRYGDIVRKAVIYRGESCKVGDIDYINVEEYLNIGPARSLLPL